MDAKKFASVTWDAEDVKVLRPEWSTEQAENFLARNQSHIQDRLVELGWSVMQDLLDYEKASEKINS